MAATGSEGGRVRLTLRLRLTLLYGVVFIAAGAALLGVTYALFKHNQTRNTTAMTISGPNFALPSGAQLSTYTRRAGAGQKRPVSRPTLIARLGSGQTNAQREQVPPQVLLNEIKQSGQAQVAAVVRRARVAVRMLASSDASSLLEWSAIALGLVALVSIGLAWWLAGRALRPLRTMNARARAISAENLHERLGVAGRSDELGELSSTFDALLSRLEAAFDSQRRFVANASHELRTPITLERTLVEVALADPDVSVDSLRRVCERVVASTEEQERLLDALLTLARSEAGVADGAMVDLAAIAEDVLTARQARLSGIELRSSLEPAVVVGDQALLERLVVNLVENAIIHNTGSQRWIAITTGTHQDEALLVVANGGESVPADDVDELFEPFRRGDGERLGAHPGGGLGLGLSIVRAVAAAHGATVQARPLPDGGLEFELHFTSAGGAKPPVGGLETVSV